MFRRLICFFVVVGSSIPFAARGADDEAQALAVKSTAIFDKHCAQCHGHEKAAAAFNILDFDALEKPRLDDMPFVTPGNVKKSAIYQRMARGDMPPENVKERPTEAD